MIRWLINSVLALVAIGAVIIFLRFRVEDDNLIIRVRDRDEREELIRNVEEVGESARSLVGKIQQQDKKKLQDNLKNKVEKAGIEKAKSSSKKLADETLEEVKAMDEEALVDILEEEQ